MSLWQKFLAVFAVLFALPGALVALIQLYDYAQPGDDGAPAELLVPQPKISKDDVAIEFIGFDTASSVETLGHYAIKGFSRASLPDLVFTFTNNSSNEVRIELDDCSFIEFAYPKEYPYKLVAGGHTQAARTIAMMTGAALMKSVGAYSATVPPGSKQLKSYGIFSVDAPSIEIKRSGKSVCKFRVGGPTVSTNRDVEIVSNREFVSVD